MPLLPGARVGIYEIIELVGAGGMGEVYRARDTKLRRDVALKVLPDSLAHDADRLTRFQREAELLATLNNPHIAAVYGLEESSDRAAIVLELVEGETLADVLSRGPLAMDEALTVAGQIVDALEAAHDRGIVHRDLKPANIKVSRDGTVKVLDFGLAKMVETSTASSVNTANPSFSPTLSVHATMAGVVLGTAAYMSPEQARGKPLDRRADVWAFGCVLFEMLAGTQPFESGDTVTDTIAAIIKNEPDWKRLPAATPPRIVALLRRCLQKDVRRRLPHIGVARLDIEDAEADAGLVVGTPERAISRVRSIVPWAIAAAAVAAAVGLAALIARHREPVGLGAVRFSLTPPDGVTLGSNVAQRGTSQPAPHFAASHDGRSIAFIGFKEDQRPQLWVRRLDAQLSRNLAGTDEASFPFWSPDDRFIGFFAQGKLKTIDANGGAPATICDAPAGEGGSWNRDGIIAFAPDDTGGLFRVPAGGGIAAPLTTLDAAHGETSHRWPQFLPDGRHFLYLAMTGARQAAPNEISQDALNDLRALYVGSVESADRTLVLRGALRAMYGSDHLLFLRGATLTAQPFDARTLRLVGEPVPVADPVATNNGNGRTGFNVSDSGMLIYRGGILGGRALLSWRDRSGKPLGSVGAADDYVEAQLSSNGRLLAVLKRMQQDSPGSPGPQLADVFVLDLTRNAIRLRLTSQPDQTKVGLTWLPDGQHVAFGAGSLPRLQGGGIYVVPVTGLGKPELLYTAQGGQRPTSSSPDGRLMAFSQISANLHRDVWLLPLSGERKATPWVQSTYNHDQATFSPDGRWIAYVSDKGGPGDVYVRAIDGDREWPVSQNGGTAPLWRADGKELFYWNLATRSLMAVPIASASTFEPGTPVKLFAVPRLRASIGQYSVAPDGQRFLILEPDTIDPQSTATQSPIEVILNWTHALNER